MSGSPVVFLLRTPRTPDPYRNAFEAAGFSVSVVPVLQFRFIHQEALKARLANPEQYSGLVVTSPRAIEALRRLNRSVKPWTDKPFFCAGPETARQASLLNFSPQGQQAGSASVLAQFIIKAAPFAKPLLFLSSNRRRKTLPTRLTKAQVRFEELVVYETLLRQSLNWPADQRPDWVVFFSPSGVEAAQADQQMNWSTVRKAAIGPTTASALEEKGLGVDAVAQAPEPEALCRAIVEQLH